MTRHCPPQLQQLERSGVIDQHSKHRSQLLHSGQAVRWVVTSKVSRERLT